MFWLLLVQALVGALLLQLQLPVLAWGGVAGRLPMVSAVVLFYVLTQRPAAGFLVVLAGGFAVDGVSLAPPGSSLLLYTLAFFVADRYRKLIVPDASITAVVFGALTGVGGVLLQAGLLWQAGAIRIQPVVLLFRVLYAFVAGGLVTPVVFALLQAMHRSLDLVCQEEEAGRVNS